jgi:hypothetical protein
MERTLQGDVRMGEYLRNNSSREEGRFEQGRETGRIGPPRRRVGLSKQGLSEADERVVQRVHGKTVLHLMERKKTAA